MKRSLIVLVLLLFVGAWLGEAMIEDSGYVLIAYQQTSIETSLWVLVMLALIGFALTHWLLNLATHFRSPADRLRQWHASRSERKAESRALSGLLARAQGDWWKARRGFAQAGDLSRSSPTLYYLEAARMAARNGDDQESRRLIDKAKQETPAAQFPADLFAAGLALEAGQVERALALAETLQQEHPTNLQLKSLRAEIYEIQQNWAALSPLLPELKKAGLISDPKLKQLRRAVALARFHTLQEANTELTLQGVQQCWEQLSFDAQQDAQVRRRYIALLTSVGAVQEALKLIGAWIDKGWDEELLLRFSELATSDLNNHLKRAKSWQKTHPESAALELALARLSRRAQLWGAAISHYQHSLTLEPHAQTLTELAGLYLQLGDNRQAEALLGSFNRSLALPEPSPEDRDTRHLILEQSD